MKRAVVVAAHADDEVLGCGATLARLYDQGWQITVIVLTTPSEGNRNAEAAAGWNVLFPQEHVKRFEGFFAGLRENYLQLDIAAGIQFVEPRLNGANVLLVPAADHHQDHSAARQIGIAAGRRFYGIIAEYEMPYSGQPTNFYCRAANYHMERKENAYAQHISQTEKADKRGGWGIEAIWARGRARGVEIGTAYAEAFTIIRGVEG